MSGRAVDVPEAVRQKAMARGAEGRRWLDRLGCLIHEIERAWKVTVGSTLPGGSESYVAAARTGAGSDAVVKLEMPPYASFASEVRTLIARRTRIRAAARTQRRAQCHVAGAARAFTPGVRVARFGPDRDSLCDAAPCLGGAGPSRSAFRGREGALALRVHRRDVGGGEPTVFSPGDRASPRLRRDPRGGLRPRAAVLVHGDAHNSNALQDPGHASRARFKLVAPTGCWPNRPTTSPSP